MVIDEIAGCAVVLRWIHLNISITTRIIAAVGISFIHSAKVIGSSCSVVFKPGMYDADIWTN
jgi:hypothetical protein